MEVHSYLVGGKNGEDAAHDGDGGDGGAAEGGQEHGGEGPRRVAHALTDEEGQAPEDRNGAQGVDVERVASPCISWDVTVPC